MSCNRFHFLALIVLLSATLIAGKHAPPNIVIFLVDDLGIGDVGCFGNKTINTPNIDQLARDGVKLTHHLAADTLCTPSRAAMLTGKYAKRVGLGRKNNETSWATLLQTAGYQTGAVGKWHLGWDVETKGDNLQGPLGHGFQYFFGLPWTLVGGFEQERHFISWNDEPLLPELATKTSNFLNIALLCIFIWLLYKILGFPKLILLVMCLFACWFILEHVRPGLMSRSIYMEKILNSQLIFGSDVVEQPIRLEHLTHNLTSKAIDFIIQSSNSPDNKPFALYYAFPNVHAPVISNKIYQGKSNHGQYGQYFRNGYCHWRGSGPVEEQWCGGYFASDHGAQHALPIIGGSNFPYKGGKWAWEGGIRIPAVVKWPGVVKPGSEIATPTGLIDWLPTIWEIAGGNSSDLPSNVDGVSYADLLTGKETTLPRRFLRHYSGSTLHALRFAGDKDTIPFVAKAYFRRTILNKEGHCGKTGQFYKCETEDEFVDDFGLEPLIFDMINDPLEKRPLDRKSEHYQNLKAVFNQEFIRAESEFYPDSQLSDPQKVLPMPWLQHCANFPRCSTEPPTYWTSILI